MTTVGERIRQSRLTQRLTQHELGERSCVAPAYISLLEKNRRRPSVDTLRRLARWLGVSAYWLETGCDDPAEALALQVLTREPPDSPLADLAFEVLQERQWADRSSTPAPHHASTNPFSTL